MIVELWIADKHDVSSNHQHLVEIAQSMFMNENALNPVAFPSLRLVLVFILNT